MYSGYILECINSSLFSQEHQNSFICSLVFILFYYVHLYVVKKKGNRAGKSAFQTLTKWRTGLYVLWLYITDVYISPQKE